MRRPLWVWVVLLVSLFSGCSAFRGGSVLFEGTDAWLESMVKLREQAAQLPDRTGMMSAQRQALDQTVTLMGEIGKNPLYIAQTVIVAILQLVLGVGFLIGAVRLYRLQLRGVTILQLCNGAAIVLGIMNFLVFSLLRSQSTVPAESGEAWLAIIGMAIIFAPLYLLPLMLLTFCSRADFAPQRD